MNTKHRLTIVLFAAMILAGGYHPAAAQTTVIFNINLKPQLEDSTLVPGRGDVVEIYGNLYPLARINLTLSDTDPVDSVFTVEINFPRRVQGQTLSYNYLLRFPLEEQTDSEQMPRRLTLRGGRMVMDPLFFDAYAR